MNCELCNKKLTENQVRNGNRFCGYSCSAKWRMSQPEIYKKVHNLEVNKKRGKARSRWLNSDNPKAQKEIERISKLNPTKDPRVRKKISDVLQSIGHAPHARGGNGHGLTKPQKILLEALGSGWQAEYIQKLGGRIPDYPTHYKIDIANDDIMLAIEVDGYSHKAIVRQKKDKKKENKLAEFGWKTIRFTNNEILSNLDFVLFRIKEVINEL